MPETGPNWARRLDRLVEGDGDVPPFVPHLQLPLPETWEPGRVLLRWTVNRGTFQDYGTVFGGFLAALADQALAMAAMTVMEDGKTFSTSDVHISFLRPVTEGQLEIEARVVHQGRRTVRTEATLRRTSDRKPAATARATQIIIPDPRSKAP